MDAVAERLDAIKQVLSFGCNVALFHASQIPPSFINSHLVYCEHEMLPPCGKDVILSYAGPADRGLASDLKGDSCVAKEVLFLVEDADEGGYIARALDYPIFTEADSWDELKRAIRDAVQCHFDVGEHPDLIRLHAVRDEVVPA